MEFSLGWIQIVAMAVIVLVTAINVRGVRLGGWIMNLFTMAKVAALGLASVRESRSSSVIGTSAYISAPWPSKALPRLPSTTKWC
jgi:hypothetical protein